MELGGGGSASLDVTMRAGTNPTSVVNNPYNMKNIQYNIRINAWVLDNSYVTNMADYARRSISNYSRINSIPEEHLPNAINTSLAQNWSGAFEWCQKLINFPDPFYNTSNATNMSRMFFYCDNVTTIPNFDTSNVTDMSEMFSKYAYPNSKLKSIPNFNTSKVTNMNEMLYSCSGINNIPNFDTSNVIDMGSMFRNCYNLTTVPNFDTSNAINMSEMFEYCYKLTTVPNFDTSKVTDMSGMFQNCSKLTSIPHFNTSNVTNTNAIFMDCDILTSVPNFNTNKVTDMSWMFYGCYNLTSVPNFDTSNVTTMYNIFSICRNLTIVPNFNTTKVKIIAGMFQSASSLTTVPNFNTSNVSDISSMFRFCSNLITVPNFDTSNVISMREMFQNCNKLTVTPILNTSNVTNICNMFSGCYNIKGDLYIESNNVSNARYLFYNTPNYIKNIYCHANTTTYNTIYANMGNNTYNPNWNTYLYTMEDNYAEIPWNGNGVYRFPTNKIQLLYTDNTPINVIEVSPYTDYNLSTTRNSTVTTYAPDVSSDIIHNGTVWGTYAGTIKFIFFKDIINMIPNIIDPGITIQGLQDPNSEIYVNNKKYNSNPFYCEFEGEQLLEIYSPNYLSISQEINIPKNTSITVDVEQNRDDAAKVTITPSVTGANITYKYGTMTNYGIANDDGTFYAPKNTDIEYVVKLTGYKKVTNTVNISDDTTINITLEMATYEDINITTPFTDNTEYLTNLVDDNNFEISGDYIQSGSSSYHKNNGTSYGYIQFTTPGEAYIDSPIEIECYVSSENNYDYAAVYIGTQVYEPSRTQIKNKTTDGNGEFIFAASGNGSLNTYTYSNLLPNTTYYLSFAYAKDSSGNSNSDRFFIKSIRFRIFG